MSSDDKTTLDFDKLFKNSAFFEALIKLRQGKELSPKEAAAYYKKAYNLLYEREQEAVSILKSGRGRSDERLRQAARFMGWITDKKSSRYNGDSIFWEYLDLTMGSYDTDSFAKIEPVSGDEALLILVDKHNFPSKDACNKFLSRYIKKRREKGAHIPNILPGE
jgi:hypothetical protein